MGLLDPDKYQRNVRSDYRLHKRGQWIYEQQQWTMDMNNSSGQRSGQWIYEQQQWTMDMNNSSGQRSGQWLYEQQQWTMDIRATAVGNGYEQQQQRAMDMNNSRGPTGKPSRKYQYHLWLP
jgi:hypothetical protein